MLNDNSPGWMADRIPTLETEPEPRSPVNDDLDDIFGSEPGSPSNNFIARDGGNTEWSDIPRLKEKHETEGYRDGVTKGKAESIQKGFDGGYGLGAVLGLRVGKILGLLEGISAALNGAMGGQSGDHFKTESERVVNLLSIAKSDLKTESVFGKEYFDADGIWKFPVKTEGEEEEVVFPDVADSHPLIKKWEDAISEEVRRWGLDLRIMENEENERDIKHVPAVKDTTLGETAIASKKGLDW